jgi:hypothetical protein
MAQCDHAAVWGAAVASEGVAEADVAYTTYLDVPRDPDMLGALLCKHKGSKWKPCVVVLKGPGLSAYKAAAESAQPLATPERSRLKFGVDLGRHDAHCCEPPPKYRERGMHVLGIKPGKGAKRCFLQWTSAAEMERWRGVIVGAMGRARAARAFVVSIPREWRAGQVLHVRLPSGRSRRVRQAFPFFAVCFG